MTEYSDKLVDKAARAVDLNWGNDLVYDTKALVRTVLNAVADNLRAEAWEQGMRTGTSRAMRKMSDEPYLPLASEADNPYRADRVEGAS